MSGRHSAGAEPEGAPEPDPDIQTPGPAQYVESVELREPSGDGPAQWGVA